MAAGRRLERLGRSCLRHRPGVRTVPSTPGCFLRPSADGFPDAARTAQGGRGVGLRQVTSSPELDAGACTTHPPHGRESLTISVRPIEVVIVSRATDNTAGAR